MRKSAAPAFPAFVFQRRREAEVEAGYTLAGQLIVDVPTPPKPKHMRKVQEIVRELVAMVKAGTMPPNAFITGWAGGAGRPPNAVDTDDDAVMSAWAARSLTIALRIDPNIKDPRVLPAHLDRDLLRQIGEEPTEH